MALYEPYVPVYITVHLGRPESNARNVTVTFPEYIKNVASSEIYPTWPENAIRANIYAQISFAMNRIYTEWYRSQGYDFDITSSTAFDQFFVFGRDTFDSVNRIVDEIFNNYLRRPGQNQPLFAQYCNGTTVTCAGLSQWGTVGLARQGMNPYEILTYYYGNNLEIVRDAPIIANIQSYPGEALRVGSRGQVVAEVQRRLNRVARNYPAIPRLIVDGVYGAATAAAVTKFQQIFRLEQDGIVGKETWYRLQYLYVSVTRLSELTAEGEEFEDQVDLFNRTLSIGDVGRDVMLVQYYLNVIAESIREVQPVAVTGTYTQATVISVLAFQRFSGLPQTGSVDPATFLRLYQHYEAIIISIPPVYGGFTPGPYPGFPLREGSVGDEVQAIQVYLLTLSRVYPEIPKTIPNGVFGPLTYDAVVAFQRLFGLNPDGVVGPITWNKITEVYMQEQQRVIESIEQYYDIDLSL